MYTENDDVFSTATPYEQLSSSAVCVMAVKALARQLNCTVSIVPSLVEHYMTNLISCISPSRINHWKRDRISDWVGELVHSAQYVNWNKHPVPIPPSSRLIHYELQNSCVTSCRKSWCESCWYSCNCEGPPIKIHFSIDLSNCYSYNHVVMYTCDRQFH